MISEQDVTNAEGEEEMKITQMAIFLSHVQKHGLTYAVLALLAQQAGLLDQVLASVGGMC